MKVIHGQAGIDDILLSKRRAEKISTFVSQDRVKQACSTTVPAGPGPALGLP